ncbi:G-patch DNA repair protein [Penicillium longicatenatum]|uniref:G-patch DNA repair protein n=1 Tax=Penicillium longicatenatum TaxID=1561947 RepID=UPI002547109E|nr:G-patch DNA repair protein [Penicillium longicatenatum]KAJ5635284.1 G-patch DNA repair protein [Penicillium longicatenatum]
MPTDSTTPAKGGGMMSLYANLLGPSADSAPGTISRAPVVFNQGDDAQSDESTAKKQQLNAASLRFQPTKRPQLSAQKTKPKPALPKAPQPSAGQPSTSGAAPVKPTLADWAAEDDDYGYVGEKRQRGGRKKRKKNHEPHEIPQNWDDIYDPSRPNNYEEYRHSDEKILEVREWKDRLYAHRMRRSLSKDSDSDDYDRPMNRMTHFTHDIKSQNDKADCVSVGQFAPPSSFAPPPNLNDAPPPPPSGSDLSGDDAFTQRARMSQRENDVDMPDYAQSIPPPPPEEPPALPSDTTGDEAYMRRLQQTHQPPPGQIPPPPSRLDAFQPTSATISRAPVRYTLPPPPEDIPASEAELEEVFAKEQPADTQGEAEAEDAQDAPRSLRPGQKGFAERLLSKYGWTKGSGLGATGSGIAKPLQVKVEKRRGTIIGGKKKGGEDTGKFGPMSEVIILRGMLDGMDLEAELESGELMQEIGEECNEKYGSVERVYIARDAGTPIPVFVKFTSPLSALRAVNALEERIFNGNAITARFFNTEKFEEGIYVD